MDLRQIHPPDCPVFEYKHHPAYPDLLRNRTACLLQELRAGLIDTMETARDTRKVHLRLFANMTPDGHDYFAGHYRGEDYRCLRNHPIYVGPDTGWEPNTVPIRMNAFSKSVSEAIAALDAAVTIPAAQISRGEKLLHSVRVACMIFAHLCQIHPYANGNGHAARFCVWAILVRYGYWLAGWPIDPSPPDPPYTHLVRAYLSGDRDPLERQVLQCVVGQ